MFESIIQNDLSFSFKFKLNPSQHGFIKKKSSVPYLVIYLFIYHLFVHRVSFTVYSDLLATPSIKSLLHSFIG
jgi:hypothetical protein